MSYFNVKQLACVRSGQYLFQDLSFSLTAGELILIQGANGSGKTSLLKILAGLASSESGTVERLGGVAYLGHRAGIKKELTVRENIALLLILARQQCDESVIQAVLRSFELQAESHRLCTTLSMGQQRKVALAALIVKQRPIWILDEPFTGLDKRSVGVMCGYFLTHLAGGGIIVLASHALDGIKPQQKIEINAC